MTVIPQGDVDARKVLLGLPCARCRAYYPAGLHACPVCGCSQRVSMGGSDIGNQAGTYGTQGVSAPGNVPGARWFAVSWTDATGEIYGSPVATLPILGRNNTSTTCGCTNPNLKGHALEETGAHRVSAYGPAEA